MKHLFFRGIFRCRLAAVLVLVLIIGYAAPTEAYAMQVNISESESDTDEFMVVGQDTFPSDISLQFEEIPEDILFDRDFMPASESGALLSAGNGSAGINAESGQYSSKLKTYLDSRNYKNDYCYSIIDDEIIKNIYSEAERKANEYLNGADYPKTSSGKYYMTVSVAGAKIECSGEKDANHRKINDLFTLILSDHPEWYFVDPSVVSYSKTTAVRDGKSISIYSSIAFTLLPEFSEKSEREKTENMLVNALSEYENAFGSITGDYLKERYIHDTVTDKCTYNSNGKYAHSIIGAFTDGNVVCEGYAKAAQMLFTIAGIRNSYVVGFKNPDERDKDGHAWNQVCIDGTWMNVDLTWDDLSGYRLENGVYVEKPLQEIGGITLGREYIYMNRSDAMFKHTENAKEVYYAVFRPAVCDNDSGNFYANPEFCDSFIAISDTGRSRKLSDYYSLADNADKIAAVNGKYLITVLSDNLPFSWEREMPGFKLIYPKDRVYYYTDTSGYNVFNLVYERDGAFVPTVIPTPEPTATATPTPEPTATATPTPKPTATATPTPKPTATATPTPKPTATATPTPEPTATATPTPKPTATATPTPEPTATATPTPKPTATATPTPEPTATATPAPEPTATATPTPEPTATATPTPEPTATATPTPEPTVTATPAPEPTDEPEPSVTTAPTAAPEPTVTAEPTASPAPETTPAPGGGGNPGGGSFGGGGGIPFFPFFPPAPGGNDEPTPAVTPAPKPTATPTPKPSATPTPSPVPSDMPETVDIGDTETPAGAGESILEEIEIAAKKTLYTGGTAGNTYTVKPGLPDNAVIVKKFSTKAPDGKTKVKFTYSSSNPDIASVSKTTGKISAKKTGTATVTCTASLKNGETKIFKIKITVKKPSVKFTSVKTSMNKGTGSYFEVSVYGYRKEDITWFTEKKNIVSVSTNAGKTKAKVSAKKEGTAEVGIKLKGANGKEIKKTVTVSVK